MSLLMDALKRAEESKRLTASKSSAPAATPTDKPELTLKPLMPPESSMAPPSASLPNSPLPELSLHIDSVDADLAAVSTEAPARRSTPAPSSKSHDTDTREMADRSSARNVFTAKQAPKSRSALWIILGLGALTTLALGGYFWWQLQSMSGGSLARPAQAPPLPRPAPPTPSAQVPALNVANATASLPEKLPAPKPAIPADSPAPPIPLFEKTVRAPRTAPYQTASDSPLRIKPSQQPKLNQPLEQAYEAFQIGRLDEAKQGYEEVLRRDTKNTDALLGLATIAARQGQAEWAQAYYLRALESDPNDATAQAGVLNTRGQADPGLSESRLKTALSSQPESTALHFALGNLYARQNRWSEAQQAYFRAYSSEPDNADFIFNLAVSLDHLNQKKLATQYYRMALDVAANRHTSFDKSQANKRALELQP